METTYIGPPLATPLQRAIAYVADLLLSFCIAMISITIVGYAGWSLSARAFEAVFLVWFACYYIGFGIALGTTPAKRFLRMRVLTYDGEKPTPDTFILRFIVFLVTFLTPFGAVISGVIMIRDENRRTLHDRAAKTLVVINYPVR